MEVAEPRGKWVFTLLHSEEEKGGEGREEDGGKGTLKCDMLWHIILQTYARGK
jgi:hypothetical protein